MAETARHRAPDSGQPSVQRTRSAASHRADAPITDSHGGSHGDGRGDGRREDSVPAPPRGSRPAALDGTLGLLLGLFAGLLGLAPWLADGARLPLQNLWAEPTLPEDMPLSALPLNQYMTSDLVALMVIGGLAAGLGLRWWAPRRRWASGCTVLGLLAIQLAATAQSFSLLKDGLRQGSFSGMYYDGLLAGVLASVAAAVVVTLAVSARRHGPVALGLALAAVPLGTWFLAWAVTSFASYNVPVVMLRITDWLPAVFIGLALAWYTAAGEGTAARAESAGTRHAAGAVDDVTGDAGPSRSRAAQAAVWILSLGLLWVLPASLMAVRAALGSRVNLGNFSAMADSALMALQDELQAGWLPVLVAAVLAAAGADVLRRVRSARTAPGPGRGGREEAGES